MTDENKVEEIENRIDNLEVRLDRLSNRMTGLTNDLDYVINSLKNHNSLAKAVMEIQEILKKQGEYIVNDIYAPSRVGER